MTPKQRAYLRALLIEQGYAHPGGGLVGKSKHLPHGPSMRERALGMDAWLDRLTVRQASELIDYLRGGDK